jgi:hypothetical protein
MRGRPQSTWCVTYSTGYKNFLRNDKRPAVLGARLFPFRDLTPSRASFAVNIK